MDPAQSRRAMDTIFERTRRINENGRRVEILTVDNHCDGAYLHQRMVEENHPRAQQVRDMLEWNGGGRYSSGVGISNIDFNGNVHSDQFSMYRTFGNVLERPSRKSGRTPPTRSWPTEDRLHHLNGRCRECRYLNLCGGGLRARAEIVTRRSLGRRSGCYLSDAEIAV